VVYFNFKDIIAACDAFALALCMLLNIKGRVYPTNSDVLIDQNPIMSFYWGIELHAEIFTISVKQFTNCRFGMMGWPCILLSFAAAQHNKFGYVTDGMLVSVVLQLVYIAKFFYWETGYFATMDMQVDRCGLYICWGCICWLPTLYALHTMCIVEQSTFMGPYLSAVILTAGLLNIGLNYFADAQRKLVRYTNGKCLIWGKPPKVIEATYKTSDGVEHTSLLLLSGFWGISRHSHYLFELAAAFCWSVPASIGWGARGGVSPFIYVIYLTILLVDRSQRDDVLCARKYGAFWDTYRAAVPYKILPGVY
jgi:7-dehydrocholesterol reductase